MERTQGTLLDGRLHYAQPRHGYRTGIEPVFLAAAVPAHPGQRVLEAGCGAGAALLCLLWRVPNLAAAGIEIDPGMAALARENLDLNGFAASVETRNIMAPVLAGPFDHVMANPPWHDPAGTQPPLRRRALATHGVGPHPWIAALAPLLAPSGTLTLALPANQGPGLLKMMDGAGLGHVTVLPLLPKTGRPPKIILVQAQRGRSAAQSLPGLVLHETNGQYTDAANAILRGGAALRVGGTHERSTRQDQEVTV